MANQVGMINLASILILKFDQAALGAAVA
jgi:hypothetical protein